MLNTPTPAPEEQAVSQVVPRAAVDVALLTGGQDRHYAVGLAMALVADGNTLDVIGSAEIDCPEFRLSPGLRFLALRGDQSRDASLSRKVTRILRYYGRLVGYAFGARPPIFHILWNNRLELIDRTLLMLYYKSLGKKIAFTAHNVNAARRDAVDTAWNRWSLRMQYRLADRIFVHTQPMATELQEEFAVEKDAITVIPYGINNAVPQTDLTADGAKQRLGIRPGEKTILFFGAIAPYKGLDLLATAFARIAGEGHSYRLVIAGLPKGGCAPYLRTVQQALAQAKVADKVVERIEYIPDEDVEVYFKAADVLALPYREIFQSGILFLAHSFGLPVVATDVGCFREDVIENETGFLCRSADPEDLAHGLRRYFDSDLFLNLARRRPAIQEFAHARHSWTVVAELTVNAYRSMLQDARGAR